MKTRWLGLPGFLLVAAQLGAAPPASVPAAAVKAPEAGPPLERRLHVAAVEASSFLWDDFNKFQQNYHPLYLGDDDPKTAWVEGVKGHGEGEWVRLKFTPMEGATRLRFRIRNGYQKSEKLFAFNSRIKEATLKLLPSGVTQKLQLKDAQGYQEFTLEQPAGELQAVELRVDATYPGSKWDDLSVSDVQLFATATSKDNPAYEKARLDKILKWKAERAEMASKFKSAVKTNMPLLPQYQVKSEDIDISVGERGESCWKNRAADPMCFIRTSLDLSKQAKLGAAAPLVDLARSTTAPDFSQFVPVRVAAVDDRPLPLTDGLCQPDLNSCEDDGCYGAIPMPLVNKLGFLRADGFNAFEQRPSPTVAEVLTEKPPECRHRDNGKAFFYAYRPKNTDGREALRALLIVRCGRVETREGTTPASKPQLLVYDEQGRLALLADADSVTALRFRTESGGPVLVGATRLNYGSLITLSQPTQVAAK